MKDKLMTALGSVGIVLFYIIMLLFCVAPFMILDLPIWAEFILILIILSTSTLGGIICIGLYVWAAIVALTHPINLVSIIFFVIAVLYILIFVIPSAKQSFGK